MLKLNLYDYSDSYILVKGTITVVRTAVYRQNKQVIFKNCVLLTNYISKINIKEVHNTKNIGLVMSRRNE